MFAGAGGAALATVRRHIRSSRAMMIIFQPVFNGLTPADSRVFG